MRLIVIQCVYAVSMKNHVAEGWSSQNVHIFHIYHIHGAATKMCARVQFVVSQMSNACPTSDHYVN